MTSKIKDNIKDLESILSSMCYPVEQDEDEDDILLKSLSKLLPPNSSWSVFLDIREIEYKARQALKSCPHSLRLLSFHNSKISFVCHICNNNVADDSLAEEIVPDLVVEEEEIVSEATTETRKDAESSPPSSSKEKTESDEEIDQLLMDTPEKEKEEETRSRPRRPSSGLKLRALSELLDNTENLPIFSSRTLEYGANPMQSIPLYEADETLTDERSERSPPASYSLKILPSSSQTRHPVSRPQVRPAVAAVRLGRPLGPPMVSLASSQVSILPSQSQPQPQLQVGRGAAQAQYLHYLPPSTSSLQQPRPGGGKVRAKLVSVPRAGGAQSQPYPPQLSVMPSAASLQLVQHRPSPSTQVGLRESNRM